MATVPETERQPSMASMAVWVFLCFVMWAWAIVGSLGVVVGLLSFVLPEWVSFEGASPGDKLSNLGPMAFVGIIGLCFVWLRVRGYLRFAGRD